MQLTQEEYQQQLIKLQAEGFKCGKWKRLEDKSEVFIEDENTSHLWNEVTAKLLYATKSGL